MSFFYESAEPIPPDHMPFWELFTILRALCC